MAPADFLDLLEFTRTRGAGLLGTLLGDEQANVPLDLEVPTTDGQVTVALIKSDPPPQRFGVFRDEDLLGVVLAAAYADVAAVLDSGLEFRADIAEGRLTLSLPADAAEAP